MARWCFGGEWSEQELGAWLRELPTCPYNFPHRPDGIAPPGDWRFDPFDARIGKEPPGPPLPEGPFQRAREGLRRYEFSDPRMVEARYDPQAPLLGRNMLLIFKAFGFRFLNPARVTHVWDQRDARNTCFGFEYATLAGHMERGYERFFVTKVHETGELFLRIEDHWTYGDFPNWWIRLGFMSFGEIARKWWPRHAARRLKKLADGEWHLTAKLVHQPLVAPNEQLRHAVPPGEFTAPPQRPRSELLHGGSADLKRRRGVICLSLLGASAMALVALRQTRARRALPNLPPDQLDTERPNTSAVAQPFDVPDAAVAAASFTANLPIAALGVDHRAEQAPWVPLAAAAKAGIDVAVCGRFFARLPLREKAWRPYCIVSVLAGLGILALSIPEALRAARALRSPQDAPGEAPVREAAERRSDEATRIGTPPAIA